MPASLAGILSVAKSGLLSHQLAIQVTSNNITNATTDGYSRQRAELVSATPLRQPEGLLGTGVRVADITRARNQLLDGAYRREASLYHGFSVAGDALSSVEAVLGEPTELGLAGSLDAFWNSWSDLSNDPTSSAARSVVVARGQQLVDHFNRTAASLDVLGSQLADQLGTGVGEVNRLLSEVAQLNGQVASATAGGQSAPTLADRRDALLDELATFVSIDVTPRDNGTVGVSINGMSVVEGTVHDTLSVSSAGGVWTVLNGSGTSLDIPAGTVGGTLQVLQDDFASIRAELDQLAQGLVERVNGVHTTGTNPLGNTGVNFFEDFGDVTTVSAQNLVLDAAILASPQAVAAGTPGGGGAYQPGANDIALSIAGLRDETSGGLLDGRTVNEAYRDLAAGVGLATASAREAAVSREVLMQSASVRRESVSGVATDEELIKVVQFQAGYTAAARLVTVVDEMYQTLLSI